MRKNKFRKGLVVAIIVLFIGASIVPSTGMMEKSIGRSILYVGGSGPGNYSIIQDAIDNAVDGDTVFVYDDSSPYYENVILNKRINLIGEDKNTTIIDGSEDGDVIYISSDCVNISNFAIRNAGNNNYDADIDIRSNNNTIIENNIHNGQNGIYLGGSNHNKIQGNNVFNNNGRGVRVYLSSNNLIKNNNVLNNSWNGIHIHYLSNNNTIKSNYIANNDRNGIAIFMSDNTIIEDNILLNSTEGISFYHSSSDIVKNNTFENCGMIFESGEVLHYFNTHLIENNTVNGKPLYYYANKIGITVPDDAGEVILANCSNFTVVNVNFSNSSIGIEFAYTTNSQIINCSSINNIDGIRVYYSENNTIFNTLIQSNSFNGINLLVSPYSHILNNTIIECDTGIEFDSSSNSIISSNYISNSIYGLTTFDSSNSVISNNNISSNNQFGIYLTMDSNNNIISGNNIPLNSGNGIYLQGNSKNNTISGNNITLNNDNGIYLTEVSKNTISGNNIFSNNDNGIEIEDSSNNTIEDNNISSNNNDGIYIVSMYRHSSNNTINSNTIYNNNNHGISLENYSNNYYSNNNVIYHNNLINNTQNAFDECNNTWDNGYPSGGNYWSDYNGTDNDGDGIGDTPCNITGGDNQDLYPLMKPYGSPIANFTYYASNRTFDGSSSYDIDGVIVLYEWDFDDGTTGQGKVVTHVYDESGTYNVTLTVTDDDGYQDSISKSVDIIGNYPPGEPIINGPLTGKAGTMYSYMFVSEDLNGDDVFYEINWGDGITDPWDGPYESNTIITMDHNWSEQGTYTIMARAKDVYDAIGDWGTLEVTMPRSKPFFYNFPLLNWLVERFPLLQRLFTILGVNVL